MTSYFRVLLVCNLVVLAALTAILHERQAHAGWIFSSVPEFPHVMPNRLVQPSDVYFVNCVLLVHLSAPEGLSYYLSGVLRRVHASWLPKQVIADSDSAMNLSVAYSFNKNLTTIG